MPHLERTQPRRGPPGRVVTTVLCALVAASCDVLLDDLPSPPSGQPPVFASFSPGAAFAGEAVTLVLPGESAGSRLEVRFGDALPVPVVREGGDWVATVPVDATTGPLRVKNANGESASAETFVAKGAGHVQEGRIVARRDLAPHVVTALTLPRRGLALLLVDAPAPALQGLQGIYVDTWVGLQDAEPAALAVSGDERVVVVVGRELSGSCPAVEGGRALVATRIEQPDGLPRDALGNLLPRTCLGVGVPDDAVLEAALSEDGARLLVTVWSETPDTEAVHEVVLATPASLRTRTGFAGPLGSPGRMGGGFVFRDGDAVWLANDDEAPASWSRATVPVDRPNGEHVTVVATHASGRIAVATTSGAVRVSESGWPPEFDEELDRTALLASAGADGTQVDGLAFADDADTLVTTQGYYVRALLHRRTHGRWIPLNELALPHPGRVTTASNGTATIVTEDGATVISTLTGDQVLALVPGTLPRALRHGRCPGGAPALVMGSASFSVAHRFDPASLVDLPCGPLSLGSGEGGMEEVEAASDGTVFARWGGGDLLRITPDGTAERLPDAMTWGDSITERRLRLVADESVLVVLERTERRVDLYDTRASSWTRAALRRSIPLGEALVDLLELASGGLALVDADSLTPIAAAELLDPQADPADGLALGFRAQLARAVGDDVLLVAEEPVGGAYEVAAVSVREGTVTAAGSIHAPGQVLDVMPSPDGRLFYVIAEDATGARTLQRLHYDRASHRLTGSDPAVPLQAAGEQVSFRVLLSSPGGERLYALDTYSDELVAIE